MKPNRHITFKPMCILLLSTLTGLSEANAPNTCKDVQWMDVSEELPLNSPGAKLASDVNSKAIAIEAAKVKSYLSCSESLLKLPPSTTAHSDGADREFKESVIASLKSGVPNKKLLAQSIYIQWLININGALPVYNTQTRSWRLSQAKMWCEKNDKPNEDVYLPNNLPLLDRGVEGLDPVAIDLAWQIISTFSSKKLKMSCNSVINEFVKAN